MGKRTESGMNMLQREKETCPVVYPNLWQPTVCACVGWVLYFSLAEVAPCSSCLTAVIYLAASFLHPPFRFLQTWMRSWASSSPGWAVPAHVFNPSELICYNFLIWPSQLYSRFMDFLVDPLLRFHAWSLVPQTLSVLCAIYRGREEQSRSCTNKHFTAYSYIPKLRCASDQ